MYKYLKYKNKYYRLKGGNAQKKILDLLHYDELINIINNLPYIPFFDKDATIQEINKFKDNLFEKYKLDEYVTILENKDYETFFEKTGLKKIIPAPALIAYKLLLKI